MSERYLVMGDNHGDAASLRRVLAAVEGETFDYVVHVGDLTDAARAGRERAVDQLAAVEPVLSSLAEVAREGLVWVWGNRDRFGDVGRDLDVGVEVPDDGTVTVGDRRFTASPDAVDPGDVLVTHMETWRLLDHFDGWAHFCGNTHRGRHLGRRLNAAFLHLPDSDGGPDADGGYFAVEVDDATFDVEVRSLGALERRECDVHRERGVQFQPPWRGCMYCEDGRILMREMAATGFYGLVDDPCEDAVDVDALVEYAAGLWEDPPGEFREEFRSYLEDVGADRYAPLARVDGGRLALAGRSYAF